MGFGFFLFIPSKLHTARVSLNCFVGRRMSKIAFIYQIPTTENKREMFVNFFTAHRSPLRIFLLNFSYFLFSVACSHSSSPKDDPSNNNKSKKISNLFQVWYNESFVLVRSNDTFHWVRKGREAGALENRSKKCLWLINRPNDGLVFFFATVRYPLHDYFYCCRPRWHNDHIEVCISIEFNRIWSNFTVIFYGWEILCTLFDVILETPNNGQWTSKIHVKWHEIRTNERTHTVHTLTISISISISILMGCERWDKRQVYCNSQCTIVWNFNSTHRLFNESSKEKTQQQQSDSKKHTENISKNKCSPIYRCTVQSISRNPFS